MKIILAPDSFKGALSAKEVTHYMAEGIRRVLPEVEIIKIPLADGGEGTVNALLSAVPGEKVWVQVHDPLMRDMNAYYAILNNGKTAVIEMALASGLTLLNNFERNPMVTTSFGTGELIRDAIERGCEEVLVSIGGSATNDAGAGMIQALGALLLDKYNHPITKGGGELNKLHHIDMSNWDPRVNNTRFIVAYDVNNPLYGDQGASKIYGHQKGASPSMIPILEKNLQHFEKIVQETFPQNNIDGAFPGSGAAGGMGFALINFLKAEPKSGIEMIMDITQLESYMQNCQEHEALVITGEGMIDGQTRFGKAPWGVAKLAKKYNLPVIVIAGSIGSDVDVLYEHIDSIFSIIDKPMHLGQAVEEARGLLANTAERVMRLWQVSRQRLS